MPSLPRFIADRAESWFGRPCRVVETQELSPTLRRVRFAGPELRGRTWSPGQEIEFRVGDRELRHYTPSHHDGSTGTCDVVFYLHAKGPGSRWAASLRGDAQVRVLGPGGGHGLVRNATRHVFLGDETAIGLFAGLAAAGRYTPFRTVLELGAESVAATLPFSPERLRRDPRRRGAGLVSWLREGVQAHALGVAYYLAGHAQTIQQLRDVLRTHEVPSRSIRTYAYWADGKSGL